ncbi:hypothetical protein JAO29_09190 [Edaphobacter sp. HDX4]|uniref:hypothetical protein n=1 Tax=Edaphobacter sp. HDX4 TaxID=2794064 RepID=UPI002FE66B1A
MNIHLHIDRLILDGVSLSVRERLHLQAAVEMELGRLLAEGGIAGGLENGAALNAVRGGTLQLSHNPSGKGLGKQVAQAVYGGIGR